jgi:predicted DNA binding CopG/RHH family protein
MSDKDNLADTAEYYDTHDISADMEAGEWSRHEGKQAETAMSGFNTRLPTTVLNDVRAIASARGISTGAWIREVIEAAVARQKAGDDLVPMSVLLAAAEEYQHRRAS